MSTLPPETPEPSPTPATPETEPTTDKEPSADNPFVAPGASDASAPAPASEPLPYAPAPEAPDVPEAPEPPAFTSPATAANSADPVAPGSAPAPAAAYDSAAPASAAYSAPPAPPAYGLAAGGATPPPNAPYGSAYAPNYPAAQQARPGSVLSIVSVIAGGLGLLFSAIAFIPFVGVIAWPVPIAGLVMGIIGKRKEPHARGLWITGIILSGLALAVCLLAFVVLMLAFGGSSTSFL